MRRREFITVIGAAAAAWPRFAHAQRSSAPVVGVIGLLTAADNSDAIAAFNQGLNGMGFLDGRNVALEFRWAENQPGQLPVLAGDLIRRRSAVAIVAAGSAAVLAAKGAAMGVIPIVFVEGDLDPVKGGLVTSLDKPGGNITGALLYDATVMPKRLEMLQEAAPGAATVGMLVNPQSAGAVAQQAEAMGAAGTLGLQLQAVNATNEDEIDNAFGSALAKPQVGALLVADDAFFLSQRERIITAAANNALPAVYPDRAYVALGGLMSYAGSIAEAYHTAGEYTGNIIVGQKPAGMPVRQPTKFETVINRKTATTLQISGELLTGADRVIE